MPKGRRKKFVLCLDYDGYPVSPEKRKIFVALSNPSSEKRGLLRVVDESGEDYLYPKGLLRAVALSPSVKKAVQAAA